MKNLILNSLNRLHRDEAGQGLVEYMLIIALVAFAATAGMSSLASGLNSAMIKIGSEYQPLPFGCFIQLNRRMSNEAPVYKYFWI